MPFHRYDIANIEQWLSNFAERGWHLSQNGLAFGIVTFEKGESKKVKYRLVPSAKQNKIPIFIGKSHANCDMQKDVNQLIGWEQVANIGPFCIYRTCKPEATELNVNSNEYISLLRVNKRRYLSEIVVLILILLLFPELYPVYLASIHIRTYNMMLALILIVYKVFNCVYSICLSNKQQNLLKATVSLSNINTGRSTMKTLWKLAEIVLIMLLLLSLTITAVSSAAKIGGVNHELYGSELPFLTLQGHLDNDYFISQNTVELIDNYDGLVREWSDLLAPKCIEYVEHTKVTLKDNDELTCGLYINYYEARNSLIAKGIVQEYYLFDSRKRNFKLLEIQNPEVYDVDYIYAYEGDLHFPVVLLQKGRIAIKAYYYQISDNHKIDFEQWVRAISESIQ